MVDSDYTLNDHDFRDCDVYAAAKYQWTIRKLGRIPKGSRLLNVGCGAGTFNRIASDAGFIVTGLEPDGSAFVRAQENSPSGVVLFNVGLEEYEVNEPFDVVVVHDVLEHIENDINAAGLLYRHLRSGGILIGSVPALSALFGLHDEKLGHYRRYSRGSLLNVLRGSFKVESIRYFGFLGIPLVAYFSRLRRIPYPVSSPGAKIPLASRVFGQVCRAETRVWVPIGTSLLFVATK